MKKKIFTILFLFYSICSFSIQPILSKSIFADNKKESSIRTLVENFIYLKVLDNNKNNEQINFFEKKINRHIKIAKDAFNSIDKTTLKSLIKKYKNSNKNIEIELINFIQKDLYNNFTRLDSKQILKKLPNLNKEDNSYKFYEEYFKEQIRLERLFKKYPSEINKIDDMEILGNRYTNGEVYLTLDDGPSKNTETLLKLLKKNNVNASFFILGSSIKKDLNNYLNLIKISLEENNLVGIHSETHKNLIKIKDFDTLKKEIYDTQNLLLKKLNYKSEYFRAPYGSRNLETIKILKKNYNYHILWNIDSQDWRKNFTSDIIIERIIRLVNLNNGGIILFHDTKPKALKCLPEIIPRLKKSGYNFKTFSE